MSSDAETYTPHAPAAYLGQEFDDVDDAKKYLLQWFSAMGWTSRAQTDRTRCIYRCKHAPQNGCPFYVSATTQRNGKLHISRLDIHTCNPTTHWNNESQKNRNSSSLKYLLPHHRSSILADRSLTPTNIKEREKVDFHNDISYMQAWRVQQAILEELDGNMADSFKYLRSYYEAVIDSDPDNRAKLKIAEDGTFQAIAIAPGACRKGGAAVRKFVAIDGTHVRTRHKLILLVLCGMDANGQVVPLAWALVPSESEEWWYWFLRFCKKSLPWLEVPNNNEEFPRDESDLLFVIISDRDKGIKAAVPQVFPDAAVRHCCQHIGDNVSSEFGVEPKRLFWPAARAKNEDEFKDAMKNLREKNEDAANYVDNIPHHTWARYAFPQPCYEHDTSNIVESLNSKWRDARALSPLHMLDEIWTSVMTMFAERRKAGKAVKTPLAAGPQKLYEELILKSNDYRVFEARKGVYQVKNVQNSRRRTVFLKYPDPDGNGTTLDPSSPKFPEAAEKIANICIVYCSCLLPSETLRPCVHAIAACKVMEVDPVIYFNDCYKTRFQKHVYRWALMPIDISSLKRDNFILPAPFKPKRGRRRTLRMRKGDRTKKTQPRVCGNCQERCGRSRRTCQAPTKESSRGERQREWCGELIDTDENSNESEWERDRSSDSDFEPTPARRKASGAKSAKGKGPAKAQGPGKKRGRPAKTATTSVETPQVVDSSSSSLSSVNLADFDTSSEDDRTLQEIEAHTPALMARAGRLSEQLKATLKERGHNDDAIGRMEARSMDSFNRRHGINVTAENADISTNDAANEDDEESWDGFADSEDNEQENQTSELPIRTPPRLRAPVAIMTSSPRASSPLSPPPPSSPPILAAPTAVPSSPVSPVKSPPAKRVRKESMRKNGKFYELIDKEKEAREQRKKNTI